jgi:hypothetical protein
MRRKIVATKEGGAITGEERIREKTTGLYGDLLFYEGRPGDYQVSRIDSLKKELGDVETEVEGFMTKDLAALNKSLAKKKLEGVEPLTRKAWDSAGADSESGSAGGAMTARERD